MKKVFVIFVLAAVIFAVVVLAFKNRFAAPDMNPDKIRVVTTLFPLYDFAKNIGGGMADVRLLLPPGVESHHFEPSPNDMAAINSADIFVYTGKFMEPWAEDIINGMSNAKTLIVDSSDGTVLIPSVFHDADEPAGSFDPHIWLDFDNARIMARNIAAAFKNKDGANSDFYDKNLSDYQNVLTLFDEKYRTALAGCAAKEIIYGGHYAFGYPAKRYALEYTAAQGLSPDSEPSAGDMVDLVKQIKDNNIKYIFYEELASPSIAETLSRETGAKMLLLSAAHNVSKSDFESGISFLAIMENNLKNLKVGLECDE